MKKNNSERRSVKKEQRRRMPVRKELTRRKQERINREEKDRRRWIICKRRGGGRWSWSDGRKIKWGRGRSSSLHEFWSCEGKKNNDKGETEETVRAMTLEAYSDSGSSEDGSEEGRKVSKRKP
jgi:hypothetical protein